MVAHSRAVAVAAAEVGPNLTDAASVDSARPGRTGGNEEYHPYGTTSWWASASGTGVSQKRYRYTGKEKDEETGLAYHGARYYAPWLGRWERPDPAGMIDGPNRFAYVRGNPIGGSDPSGLGTAQTGTTTWEGTEIPAYGSDENPAEEVNVVAGVKAGPTISAPQPFDWKQANLDIALGRVAPERYLAQWGGDGGVLDIDYQIYRPWYLAATVARGVAGNLFGSNQTDVSYEVAELLGTIGPAVGPGLVARGGAVLGRSGVTSQMTSRTTGVRVSPRTIDNITKASRDTLIGYHDPDDLLFALGDNQVASLDLEEAHPRPSFDEPGVWIPENLGIRMAYQSCPNTHQGFSGEAECIAGAGQTSAPNPPEAQERAAT